VTAKTKLPPGAFLGGAKSRLLPASIPFRFFGAAIVFHFVAWLALLGGAADLPRFAGGPGPVLAALHLLTLGVLAMSAIGASLQLLPVATRQPVSAATHAPAAIWWLYTPGVAALALGMGAVIPALAAAGAVAVVLALIGFALLLARNLRGARGMTAVVAHGWAALACLIVALATALSLVWAWLGAPMLLRETALALHVAFAAYGFMGLLALGLAYILVPMFALAPNPNERRALASCTLAVAALLLAALAAFGVAPVALRIAAVALGAAAIALHLLLMRAALALGMRRELGRSFVMVRFAWAMLATSLALGLALALDAPLPGLAPLFGLALVVGWLMTFLFGMLQRILPFLASMHAGGGGKGKRPPTPSAMTAERPLAWHFACHFAALSGLALAIVLRLPWIATVAAAVGAMGAAAFGAFFVILLRRLEGRAA
jgi:hypothetical protein